MTNEEMLLRIENGWIPVERGTDSKILWVEIPKETLRVAAPPHNGFVQVLNNEIVAEWTADEVRWIAPTNLVVQRVP